MNADTNMNVFLMQPAVAIVRKNELHTNGCLDRVNRLAERRHYRIADSLDDTTAVFLDMRKQQAIVPLDHRHAGNISVLFKICGGTFDIAEEDRYSGPHLLQLMVKRRV